MITPPEGIKKQVFGGVLFCLGVITALLSGIIGFELDIFYVAIGIIGIMLFLYGSLQRKRNESTVQSPMNKYCTMTCPVAGDHAGSTNCGADASPPHSQA